MLPKSNDPSLIIEDEDIFDPIAGRYRDSLTSSAPHSDIALSQNDTESHQSEVSAQYITRETDDKESNQHQASSSEESSENNSDDGIEVIAAGAMCKCTVGKKAGNLTKITLWTHGGTSTVPQRAKKYDQFKKKYDLGLCDFFMNYLAKDYAIDYHIKPNNIIEKHVPKGKKEDEIFQYRYYYHDEQETEYFLCAVMGYLTQKWLKGSSKVQTGNDWVKVTVDRVTRYYQKDGTNKCLLITIPGTLEIPGFFSYHKNTTRVCANVDHYAVMLAAIADTRYTDFRFNGATDYEGQGHPSVGHINGKNLDLRYLKTESPESSIYINTKGGWDVLDLTRHNEFMKKAYDRGFKQFYIMKSS